LTLLYQHALLLIFLIVGVIIRSVSPHEQTPRINAMRFHSLIAILVGATSHVVAEPILIQPLHSPIPPPAPNTRSKHAESAISLPALVADDSRFATRRASASASYWLEEIQHQGISAFNSAPGTYQVFRNVKSFGAKGM
jgi:glucan 1,3-beta-glucosidase